MARGQSRGGEGRNATCRARRIRYPSDQGLFAAAASAQTATAELRNAQGGAVGSAILTEGPQGVRLQVTVSGLPPGRHGFHIHAVGTCDPPNFASAGGHFNPDGKHHGWMHPAGARVGDLFNLENNSDGGGGWNSAFPA
jgi:Cu/Zn superoxide dismutase